MKYINKFKWKLVVLFAVMSITIGGTVAYFYAETSEVTNQFEKVYVNVAVVKDSKQYEDNAESRSNLLDADVGNLKDFTILNKDSDDYPTGNTYVRVRVIPIVQCTNPDKTVSDVAFDVKDEIVVESSDNKWEKRNDGYWYYTEPIAPNATTSKFSINTSAALNLLNGTGYTLQVQVLTDGVQAYSDLIDYKNAWFGN